MSIFRKLKDIFSAKEEENTAPQPVSEEIDEPEEPAETPVVDEKKLAEARRREEALLDALSALHIAQNDTQTSSFLLMHSYRFEAPFSRLDLHNMVNEIGRAHV